MLSNSTGTTNQSFDFGHERTAEPQPSHALVRLVNSLAATYSVQLCGAASLSDSTLNPVHSLGNGQPPTPFEQVDVSSASPRVLLAGDGKCGNTGTEVRPNSSVKPVKTY